MHVYLVVTVTTVTTCTNVYVPTVLQYCRYVHAGTVAVLPVAVATGSAATCSNAWQHMSALKRSVLLTSVRCACATCLGCDASMALPSVTHMLATEHA